MAVRINFPPYGPLPSFFNSLVEKGKFGERFIQFSDINVFEQAVVHSELLEHLPENTTVVDLRVTVPPAYIYAIGSSGTFVYETKWGSSRLVITGLSLTIEATDPRSFLDTHRAVLNELITYNHKELVQNY